MCILSQFFTEYLVQLHAVRSDELLLQRGIELIQMDYYEAKAESRENGSQLFLYQSECFII